MNTLALQGSVGQKGNNNSNDVTAVQRRLIELGFDWITDDGNIGEHTIRVIKLFQAIKNGSSKLGNPDGLINVDMSTHKWLQANNAPRWMKMPKGSSAEGFVNKETGNGDFGTSWLIDAVRNAAKEYEQNYLNSHPNAALLSTNDISKPMGGIYTPHARHQTGLECDIYLPRKDGGAGGGITVDSSQYDQEAMRAMIKAFRNQELADVIYLNDDDLIREGLCTSMPNHHHHAHFEINPPIMEMN